MSEWIDPELSAEEDAEVKRKRREASDRQSRKLGEKLLQGWCMLEETCPAGCLVPLMRSRQGREYCVSCELFADEIEEKMQAAKQQAAQAKPSPTVPDLEEVSEPRCQIEHTTEPEHAPAVATSQQQTSTSTTETATGLPSFSSFPAPVHFPVPAAQPEFQVNPYPGLAPPQHDQHHHQHDHHAQHDQHHHQHHLHAQEAHHHHHHAHQKPLGHQHIDAVLATLYNKMEEARQRLAEAPVAQCTQLMGVIAECARTIEALYSLATKL